MSDEENEDTLASVGDYKHGSITRIRLENFLTYSDAVIIPGPRLNMVVGPNGTGKSSVLNAICLGLGGTPGVLGRADDVRAFVQHGKDKAVIEIALAPGDHVIRREMDTHKGSERGRGRGASTFYINDEKVTEKEVQGLVRDTYHIQVSNLCTFLPQDKVGNFSGLTPKEYMAALEKTLSPDVYETHQELIEAERALRNKDVNWKALEKKLNDVKREHQELESVKEKIEQRMQALQQMDLLEKKRLWLEVESLREQGLELKEQKNEIKQKLQKAMQAQAPLQEKLTDIKAQAQAREQALRQAQQQAVNIRKNVDKEREKYEDHDSNIDEILNEWHTFQAEEADLENRVKQAEEKVAAVKASGTDFPSMENLKHAEAETKQVYQDLRKQLTDTKHKEMSLKDGFRETESEATRLQNKLANLANESKQRKERVFRQYRNLEKIDKWIQEHRNDFRKPVSGPIAVLANPSTPYAAAILEQHVKQSVWKGFVVQTKADYDLLYQKIRDELGIPINIFNVERTREVMRPYSDAKMRVLKEQHGVQGYLDELVDCPEPVRQVLLVQGGIDKVLVGGDKTMQSIDTRGLVEFLSESERSDQDKRGFVIVAKNGGRTHKFTCSISRYSRKPALRQDDVGQSRMLALGSDPEVQKRTEAELEKVHDHMNELKPQLNSASEQRQDIEAKAQEASAKVDAAKKRVESMNKWLHKLEVAKRKYEDLEKQVRQAKDKSRPKQLAEKLMKRIAASIKTLQTHAANQENLDQLKLSEAKASLDKNSVAVKEHRLQSELEEMHQKSQKFGKEAQDIQVEFTRVKADLRRKKDEVEKKAPLKDEDGNDLPLRDELEALGVESLAEVEAAYEEAEQRANGIVDNPEALKKYEEQKKLITELSEQLEEAKSTKTGKMNAIKSRRRRWEATLDETVSKISALFSGYMAEMDCAGEVVLRKGEEGTDEYEGLGNFADWGIEIRVSFRQGSELQLLDSMKQSGGERSVSTIMFLMALQDQMKAPFRCVDEINQGLDDRNERLVFKRIVRNSTKPPKNGDPKAHAGQYFLITPKLLPNLTDMEEEAMTVLFVFNGPFNMKSPTEWSVEDIAGAGLSRKKRNRGEADDEENAGNNLRAGDRAYGKKTRRPLED